MQNRVMLKLFEICLLPAMLCELAGWGRMLTKEIDDIGRENAKQSTQLLQVLISTQRMQSKAFNYCKSQYQHQLLLYNDAIYQTGFSIGEAWRYTQFHDFFKLPPPINADAPMRCSPPKNEAPFMKIIPRKKPKKSETVINTCVSLIKRYQQKMGEIPHKHDFLTWNILKFIRKIFSTKNIILLD